MSQNNTDSSGCGGLTSCLIFGAVFIGFFWGLFFFTQFYIGEYPPHIISRENRNRILYLAFLFPVLGVLGIWALYLLIRLLYLLIQLPGTVFRWVSKAIEKVGVKRKKGDLK